VIDELDEGELVGAWREFVWYCEERERHLRERMPQEK